MRINHNIAALNTHRQLSSASDAQSKSMEKLSSGQRINRAADDAAGLSISEKMRSQIRGLDMATRNAQDGVSFIQTAEGALNEVSDMALRLKELAVQVTNETYSTDDKANIGAEMNALGTAMNEILTETKFNGIDVFGTGAAIKYGEDASLTVDIAAATKTNFALLKTATDAAAATPGGVTVALVEDAITEINTNRATYGAQQNQLEHVIRNQGTTAENLQSAESRIRDVDMAKEMMTQTKNSILAQASQAMLAQSNQMPQGVLQLLR
ncbi:flagellin [Neobacillus sp. YX16]|uniref:flagellin N-terminal helical domain-containing protein n=1 Tax=Neobacillus sp. YX16 TaxID=3047874 RepID=UPI0024C23B30|nr:flagellin [Neobacillus sp. YX16]WHZ05398.1 flagellin [Neobacillus sp. YX16]